MYIYIYVYIHIGLTRGVYTTKARLPSLLFFPFSSLVRGRTVATARQPPVALIGWQREREERERRAFHGTFALAHAHACTRTLICTRTSQGCTMSTAPPHTHTPAPARHLHLYKPGVPASRGTPVCAHRTLIALAQARGAHARHPGIRTSPAPAPHLHLHHTRGWRRHQSDAKPAQPRVNSTHQGSFF